MTVTTTLIGIALLILAAVLAHVALTFDMPRPRTDRDDGAQL